MAKKAVGPLTDVDMGNGPENTAPIPKPARKPRTPKSQGPEVRVVEKEGVPVALVHSLSDESAIQTVTGKVTARVVTTAEALNIQDKYKLLLTNDYPANPPTTTE